MEKKFHYAPAASRLGMSDTEMNTHWEHALPVYRNAPHVWNVGGQDNVSAFLLDTGDGLILIDTGLDTSTLYLLIDRIWRSGHDPLDIREIFLTHWHGDHTCCARILHEMTGARLWISKLDEIEHQKHKDDTFPSSIIPYEADCLYDNTKPFVMGRFSITTRTVPGHTAGSTAFFFDDTDDVTGKTYKVALHGGLGVNARFMARENLLKLGLPADQTLTFIKDCEELAQMPVDICLCSHLNQGNILPNIPRDDPDDYTVFVADYLWHDMLLDRAEAAKQFCPEVYGRNTTKNTR